MVSMYVGEYNIFHTPDKADSVWSQQKLVCAKLHLLCFQQQPVLNIMHIDKTRILHCHKNNLL